MDNPPPCGYYALLRASERVRCRRERLSDHAQTRAQQLCAAMRRDTMGIYRVFAGKAIWRNYVWRSTRPWAP
jgi:hypothetical protein